jgi:hypothetical protein
MSIRTPGFGGHAIDPEDVATVTAVFDASYFPATYGSSWCGEYEHGAAGVWRAPC